MKYIIFLWKPLIEISLLWFVIYIVLLFIQGTRAVQVLKGVIILVFGFFIAQRLQLDSINWIMTKLFALSVIGFFILFQPELRRGLASLGQKPFFNMIFHEDKVLEQIVEATNFLSKKKTGALIAIQRESNLKNYIESGITIDAEVSTELINTIFVPGVPLHDGGIIVDQNRIVAAGCLFPLTQNPRISKALGTRHRAALGLSEETDAVVVVVSEETGNISLAISGKLTRDLDRESLLRVLNNIFHHEARKKTLAELFSRPKQ